MPVFKSAQEYRQFFGVTKEQEDHLRKHTLEYDEKQEGEHYLRPETRQFLRSLDIESLFDLGDVALSTLAEDQNFKPGYLVDIEFWAVNNGGVLLKIDRPNYALTMGLKIDSYEGLQEKAPAFFEKHMNKRSLYDEAADAENDGISEPVATEDEPEIVQDNLPEEPDDTGKAKPVAETISEQPDIQADEIATEQAPAQPAKKTYTEEEIDQIFADYEAKGAFAHYNALPLQNINFSVSVKNAFADYNIKTAGDLIRLSASDVGLMSGIGDAALRNIRNATEESSVFFAKPGKTDVFSYKYKRYKVEALPTFQKLLEENKLDTWLAHSETLVNKIYPDWNKKEKENSMSEVQPEGRFEKLLVEKNVNPDIFRYLHEVRLVDAYSVQGDDRSFVMDPSTKKSMDKAGVHSAHAHLSYEGVYSYWSDKKTRDLHSWMNGHDVPTITQFKDMSKDDIEAVAQAGLERMNQVKPDWEQRIEKRNNAFYDGRSIKGWLTQFNVPEHALDHLKYATIEPNVHGKKGLSVEIIYGDVRDKLHEHGVKTAFDMINKSSSQLYDMVWDNRYTDQGNRNRLKSVATWITRVGGFILTEDCEMASFVKETRAQGDLYESLNVPNLYDLQDGLGDYLVQSWGNAVERDPSIEQKMYDERTKSPFLTMFSVVQGVQLHKNEEELNNLIIIEEENRIAAEEELRKQQEADAKAEQKRKQEEAIALKEHQQSLSDAYKQSWVDIHVHAYVKANAENLNKVIGDVESIRKVKDNYDPDLRKFIFADVSLKSRGEVMNTFSHPVRIKIEDYVRNNSMLINAPGHFTEAYGDMIRNEIEEAKTLTIIDEKRRKLAEGFGLNYQRTYLTDQEIKEKLKGQGPMFGLSPDKPK